MTLILGTHAQPRLRTRSGPDQGTEVTCTIDKVHCIVYESSAAITFGFFCDD